MPINEDSVFDKREPIRKGKSNKRTLIKASGITREGALEGRVISVAAKTSIIEYVNENNEIIRLECFTGGSVISPHKHSTIVSAGDKVYFMPGEANEGSQCYGNIIKVDERKSKLSRVDPANTNREQVLASNIDGVLILSSTFDPEINPRLIDRFLVSAMLGKIEAAICVNKIDLAEKDVFEDFFEIYKKMNIPVFFISAKHGEGTDELKKYLQNRTTVISGPSGAGKSTLLNRIMGKPVQTVQEISERTGKGRHTTSFASGFDLEGGGHLIDTPGIREFGIWDLTKDELTLFFPEFNEFFHGCKYLPCTHTHEPHCKVQEAREKGLIAEERYESYLNILETLDK